MFREQNEVYHDLNRESSKKINLKEGAEPRLQRAIYYARTIVIILKQLKARVLARGVT